MTYKLTNQRINLAILLSMLVGCSTLGDLPPGTQLQSSTFGLKLAPGAVDGTPLAIGSHTTIITTAQPTENAGGTNLNRFEATAPYTHIKSTVATGAIGEEIKAAGGPAALEHLLGTSNAELPTSNFDVESSKFDVPLPLPRTDLEAPEPRFVE